MDKNIYETLIIFKLGKGKDNVTRYKNFLQKYSDKKRVAVKDLEERDLAYPLKETYTRGYYAMFDWQGTAENASELERQLCMDDEILKYMTVKLDETANIELEDYVPEEVNKSEQPLHVTQDAWDEIFGEK